MTAEVGLGRGRDGARIGPAAACALLLLVAAQAADYVTFLAMVGVQGIAAERNPIVVAIASHGLGVLATAKVACIVLVASVFVISRVRRPSAARVTLGTGILVGVIGAFSNLAAI